MKMNDNHLSAKKKKRNFDLANGHADDHSINFAKKIKLNGFLNHCDDDGSKEPSIYKESTNYVTVTARPDLLPPPPSIFQRSTSHEKKEKREWENNFLKKIFNGEWPAHAADGDPSQKAVENIFGVPVLKRNDVKPASRQKNFHGVVEDLQPVRKSKRNPKKRNKIKIVPFVESDVSVLGAEIKSDDSITSYADFHEVPNGNSFIVHLHHPCRFSFRGELKITVIAGAVEILGLVLNKSFKFKTVNAYSPKFYTPLTVETLGIEEKNFQLCSNDLCTVLTKFKIEEILECYKPNDAVLLIEQEMSTFGVAVDKYLELPVFPKNLEDILSETKSLKKLQSMFMFGKSAHEKEFRKSKQWDSVKLNKCSVLCGGKGVGKSTLLRYYANQVISKGEKVLVLDFDPGQPEFTPPGFLSAVLVDKPLLGPNFTHTTDGEIMIYFGHINTVECPSKYLECVSYIISWCKQNETLANMKWLVNTMGFCKGLGVELMISILKLTEPDTVIQIESSNELDNYPFKLTSKNINGRKGFGKMEFQNNLVYEFHPISSEVKTEENYTRNELVPAKLRSIMMVSYFSKLLCLPHCNFNGVQPYVISFSKLYLGINHFILPRDILKAFNGSIVSLEHFEHTNEIIISSTRKKDDNFKIVLKQKLSPSVGLGFVRGIDSVENKFYVLSHLPADKLKDINCLTLGKINSPDFMFSKQETVSVPTLYTTFINSQETMQVKRSFRKIF